MCLELKKKFGKQFNHIIENFRENPNLLSVNSQNYKNLKENISKNYPKISTEERNYIQSFFKKDLSNLKKTTNINFLYENRQKITK